MKLRSLLLAVVLAATSPSSATEAADATQNVGPEIIKFKMGDLHLPFNHWKHQKLGDNECLNCHKPGEWKIKEWDKEIAHLICICCHEKKNKGPVECKECHGPTYTSMQKGQP